MEMQRPRCNIHIYITMCKTSNNETLNRGNCKGIPHYIILIFHI